MNKLLDSSNVFESIKHIDESSNEYWYARELQVALGYKLWQKFSVIIDKSKISCKASKYNILDHFIQVDKMIKLPKGATRNIIDYKLSRYACYLITMNGDSRKEVIALGQTYFAVQTNKKLKNENVTEEDKANKIHYNMGRDIRNFIKSQGGTMPEELSTPNRSIKEIDYNKEDN